MNLTEVTDWHNRRANLELVAKRAKAHGYPLLAWPEDTLLLRIDDLPQLDRRNENKPLEWDILRPCGFFVVRNDAELRERLEAGKAYACAAITAVGHYVQVYEVSAR